MLEIRRSVFESSLLQTIEDNSLIVIDSFTTPSNATGFAEMVTPHGQYVESRLKTIIGDDSRITKVNLVGHGASGVAEAFIRALSDVEKNIDTSIPQVVSVSAVPSPEQFDERSLAQFHLLVEGVQKKELFL